MKSANGVRFRGTVASRSEASARLSTPGDAVLVERGRPRLLIISCPCGCGEQFPINLDPRAGPAWRLYRESRRGLSVYPSVWRESGCRSHYVIWRNKIYLFGRYEEDFETAPETEAFAKLVESIRNLLPATGLVAFSEIAESLDAIPWDVLNACRRIVRIGWAREGTGNERGFFGTAEAKRFDSDL